MNTKFIQKLSAYRSVTGETFGDQLRSYNDIERMLKDIEVSAEEWISDGAGDLEVQLQNLLNLVERTRQCYADENHLGLARNLYAVGEYVGRLNHVEGWHADLLGTRQRTLAGKSTRYPHGDIIRSAERSLRNGTKPHKLTTEVLNSLANPPSRPVVLKVLQDAGLLPRRKNKKK